jgi:hypothetical protein
MYRLAQVANTAGQLIIPSRDRRVTRLLPALIGGMLIAYQKRCTSMCTRSHIQTNLLQLSVSYHICPTSTQSFRWLGANSLFPLDLTATATGTAWKSIPHL